ncbi:TPA: hypothetical protein ACH3X1_002207 [Trebouxia sp. C0004]
MSASQIVQGRQHTPGHALADVFFAAERQYYRVKSLRTQALRTFHRPKQQIRANLQTDTSGEARELCKFHLKQQLVGVNRGIFGIKAAKTEAIDTLLSELQQSAVGQHPTDDLAQLSGKWNLLYTSLVIKGARKTKLGLREFISLGDFEQIIDTESKTAVRPYPT